MDRTEKTPSTRTGVGLVGTVSATLRAWIAEGRYQPGDKLPSEAKLAAEHGVSRTVLREAIATLRADGLVKPRQGAGIFVLPPAAARALPFGDIDPARLSSVLEMLELRLPIEVEAAGLAARRRSPAQEEGIIAGYRAIGAAATAGEPTAPLDFALHLAIAEATNNPRFADFLRLIGPAMIPRQALFDAGRDAPPSLAPAQLQAEHERIVWAISAGDAEGARAAMRDHLAGSQQRYRELIRR